MRSVATDGNSQRMRDAVGIRSDESALLTVLLRRCFIRSGTCTVKSTKGGGLEIYTEVLLVPAMHLCQTHPMWKPNCETGRKGIPASKQSESSAGQR